MRRHPGCGYRGEGSTGVGIHSRVLHVVLVICFSVQAQGAPMSQLSVRRTRETRKPWPWTRANSVNIAQVATSWAVRGVARDTEHTPRTRLVALGARPALSASSRGCGWWKGGSVGAALSGLEGCEVEAGSRSYGDAVVPIVCWCSGDPGAQCCVYRNSRLILNKDASEIHSDSSVPSMLAHPQKRTKVDSISIYISIRLVCSASVERGVVRRHVLRQERLLSEPHMCRHTSSSGASVGTAVCTHLQLLGWDGGAV